MKNGKSNGTSHRRLALASLKTAILEGATWRYAHLVTAAVQAGATDEDIDHIVYDALQELFTCAEQPLNSRQLDYARRHPFPAHTVES